MSMNPKFTLRKIVILAMIFLPLFFSLQLKAQQLKFGFHAERNIYRVETGGAVTYLFPKHFGLGAYYQQEWGNPPETNARPYNLKGILIDIPFYYCEKIEFLGRFKPSLANGRFVVVIPALETRLTVLEFLQLGTEISYRAGYPAVALNMNFVLDFN